MVQKSKSPQPDSSPMLLNAEQIAKRRVPLEEAELRLTTPGVWKCEYCNKRYAHERMFMQHVCKEKRKSDALASPTGQAAYGYYLTWMRLKRRGSVPAETFMGSKMFMPFINFAEHVVKAGIVYPEKYIELMVEHDAQPALWRGPDYYNRYLLWVDMKVPPMEQVEKGAALLFDLAEREGVSHTKIIEHLGAQRIFGMLHKSQLTPWLLLRSAGFKRLAATFDTAQKKVFNELVDVKVWAPKFDAEPALLRKITNIVEELGL